MRHVRRKSPSNYNWNVLRYRDINSVANDGDVSDTWRHHCPRCHTTARNVLSKEGKRQLISSRESLRSRCFPVDSFSHLMYIAETRDLFSIQTTRSVWTTNVSNVVEEEVVEEEVAAEVHRSLRKRHTSTFLRTSLSGKLMKNFLFLKVCRIIHIYKRHS